MKKVILSLLFLCTLLVSCEEDTTANVSEILKLPTIEILGDNPAFVAQGGSYTDAGAIAKDADGNVIPYGTVVSGKYRKAFSLNTAKTDEYLYSYTAFNIPISERKVIVYNNGDLVTSIEGVYTCTIKRNGATPGPSYIDIEYIHIWKNVDGTYELSDAFGGWYEYGRALGVGYITPGGKINAIDIPSNSFTFPGNPLTNTGFGGEAELTSMTVDPDTKTIVFTTVWDTGTTVYNFEATLTQFQP